jgi:hypothetical protein
MFSRTGADRPETEDLAFPNRSMELQIGAFEKGRYSEYRFNGSRAD